MVRYTGTFVCLLISAVFLGCSDEENDAPCGGFCPPAECVENRCVPRRMIAERYDAPLTRELRAMVSAAMPPADDAQTRKALKARLEAQVITCPPSNPLTPPLTPSLIPPLTPSLTPPSPP